MARAFALCKKSEILRDIERRRRGAESSGEARRRQRTWGRAHRCTMPQRREMCNHFFHIHYQASTSKCSN